MLYRTIKRMVLRGQLEGMAQKLDIFLAAGRISGAEYLELTGLLAG